MRKLKLKLPPADPKSLQKVLQRADKIQAAMGTEKKGAAAVTKAEKRKKLEAKLAKLTKKAIMLQRRARKLERLIARKEWRAAVVEGELKQLREALALIEPKKKKGHDETD